MPCRAVPPQRNAGANAISIALCITTRLIELTNPFRVEPTRKKAIDSHIMWSDFVREIRDEHRQTGTKAIADGDAGKHLHRRTGEHHRN